MTRLYCPFTPDDLDELAGGALTVHTAFAVTPEVRALVPDGDDELFEHLATQFAAAASKAARIVVAALELPPTRVVPADPSHTPGQVSVNGDVKRRDVVCFLVADEGEHARDDADLELSWYDAGELDVVRSLV